MIADILRENTTKRSMFGMFQESSTLSATYTVSGTLATKCRRKYVNINTQERSFVDNGMELCSVVNINQTSQTHQ